MALRSLAPFCNYSIGIDELKTLKLWKGVIGEFIGMTLFLLATYSTAYNKPYIPVAFGFSIVVLVQAFANISGGHLNNAVSLGLVLAGRCPLIRCLLYTVAQICGAIFGVAIVNGTIPSEWGYGLCSLTTSISSGILLETLFTTVLVLVVLSVTDSERTANSENGTIKIGLAVFLAHVILVPLTGCGINPARVTGSAVVAGNFTDIWVYWIGGYFGSILAPLIYFALAPETDDKKAETEQEMKAQETC